MRQVLEHLLPTDEIGLVRGGSQSNGRPWGDRDSEGFVGAPELQLRPAGIDLTILSIVPNGGAGEGTFGTVGTKAIVNVAEELRIDDWNGGELRLVAHDYSEPVTVSPSTFRKGAATVLRCTPSKTATVTFDVAADTLVLLSHGFRDGQEVVLATTGVLPNLTPGAVYYLRDVTEHTARLSQQPGGSAINLAGGSGTHTVRARAHLLVQWTVAPTQPSLSATFGSGAPGTVTLVGHNLPLLSFVRFSGTAPAALTASFSFVVSSATADDFFVSTLRGGASLSFATSGSGLNVHVVGLINVAGYVHLNDRFTSYENVLVTTPFQPIEPGPYPNDPPVVPGVSLQPDVVKHEDLALALPFTWNEGIEGAGFVGTVQVASLVCTLQGGQTIQAGVFDGGFARVGNSKGRVAASTSSSFTVEAWIGGQPPSVTNLAAHVHLPHYRNNTHHYSAGEGFLYPSDDMQPGGIGEGGAPTEGIIYSRPRGRFRGCYVSRYPVLSLPVAAVINASLQAQAKTVTSSQWTISLGTGELIVQWNTLAHDPATGVVPFELFLRPGNLVVLAGVGQTPNLDGKVWRVVRVQHTTAALGSSVALVPYDASTDPLPVAVSGTVPSGAVLTRASWKPKHKFGSLLPAAWRMANALGKRIVVTHLSVNSSSQVLRRDNANYGYQGQLGWWNDDTQFDWTPSNPAGLAARLQRLATFIAPRAVKASLGATRTLKHVGIDVWQGESEAILSAAQRELAERTMPTFLRWLNSVIVAAGLSPFPPGVPVPAQWARITHDPWELPSLPLSTTSYQGNVAGDVEGLVNRAIVRTTALYGFGGSVNPDTNKHPKVSFDSAHYNGIGMAMNGKEIAAILLRAIDLAFSMGLGKEAIAVAQEALQALGESPTTVISLEPPNKTTQALACSIALPRARDYVLQCHTWSFAKERIALVELENKVSTWRHAYALPPHLLKPNLILAPDAPDDVQIRELQQASPLLQWKFGIRPMPATQPHVVETEDDFRILRTNQADAHCVFTRSNVDFRNWTPKAREGCVLQLASKLVGGFAKGRSGAVAVAEFTRQAYVLLQMAAADDYEFGTDVRPEPICPWLPPQLRP